eukprot:PhF_6_TR33675/c1_g1_i15/m.49320/K00737/MGAT3; beta-1,4-mannosyl-glycoprotein beta-1,4-N-acetylglucosaminyltransferase
MLSWRAKYVLLLVSGYFFVHTRISPSKQQHDPEPTREPVIEYIEYNESNLTPVPRATPSSPIVIDVFTFQSEFDMLELRIQELWDVVDAFLVVEANMTFTGKPKPTHFANKHASNTYYNDIFGKYKSKLRWLIIPYSILTETVKLVVNNATLPPLACGKADPLRCERMSASRRENLHRFAMHDALLKLGVRVGDFIHLSDVDEIPRASVMHKVLDPQSNLNFPVTLELKLFTYNYKTLVPKIFWRTTVFRATEKDIYDGLSVVNRVTRGNSTIKNAGWHCSWCFATFDRYLEKMGSFSHVEIDTPENRDLNRVKKGICEYKAFTTGHRYFKVDEKTIDAPKYLIQHRTQKRFAHLLPLLKSPLCD